MEKIMDDYAAFERAMDRDKVYLDLDFDEICSGRELVDFYRSKFG